MQNIGYSIGNIWKWDKLYFLAFVPHIPLSVFLPLAGIYFPKVLIDLITSRASDLRILSVTAIYCAILAAAGLIQVCTAAKFNSIRYTFSFHYHGTCDTKHRTMDYESAENPKISDMRNQSYMGGSASESIVKTLNDFLVNILGIFTYGSIIMLINPLILALLIVSAIVNYLMMSHVRKYNDKNRDNWAHLDRRNGYLFKASQDYDRGKDIRIYNMRTWLESLTEHYQGLRMAWHKKCWNKELLQSFVDGVLRFARNGAAYAVLIYMLLNGDIDVSSFVFYFGAIAGFSTWLTSVVGQFNTIASYSADINRLRAYLELSDKFNHGKGVALPKRSEIPYSIELKNLSYTYPSNDVPTIKDVSFTIRKGEKLAVVGLNGAGKTTLVKLICGLYYPTSGQVLLNGKNISDYNIEEYYTQFSAVFQDINLVPITIARFVSGSGFNVDGDKVAAAINLAGLDKVVAKLPNGIDTTLMKGIYDDGIDLSGGEKQKLMLARALYKDAPVIVLDEPTAALDPIAESELYEKYNQLTSGKTAIYISHRLASTRFCDRIIFVQDGAIAECGSHDELMRKGGLYANMFNIQSHYYKEGASDEE